MNFNKIIEYLNNLNHNNNLFNYYKKIINFKNDHFIPAVKFDTALFLFWITSLKKPVKILEIGFGSGASSLFINKGIDKIDYFLSLERDNNRYQRGIKLFNHLNINNIELHKIDAFKFFHKTNHKFDFIFLDAVKREYIDYLPHIKNLLKKNGIFITDNILFDGKIIDDRLDEKYINGVKKLKSFNKELSNNNYVNTFFLSIGDGLSLSIKIK